MADAFIPITDFGKVEPCITPAEAAERVAAIAGAPRMARKLSGDKIVTFYNGRISPDDVAWTDARRLAATAILEKLLLGSIRSYVEAADSGKHFRIPVGYWAMKSGAEDPWSVLARFDRCDWAHGFDESMVDQPILISEADTPRVTVITSGERHVEPDPAEVSLVTDSNPVSSAKAIRECEDWLRAELGRAETAHLLRDDFKRIAVQERYVGRLFGRGFLKAWKKVVIDFPGRARSGPKPKA